MAGSGAIPIQSVLRKAAADAWAAHPSVIPENRLKPISGALALPAPSASPLVGSARLGWAKVISVAD